MDGSSNEAKQILQAVNESEQALTNSDLSRAAGCSWGAAQAIALKLALEGKIKALPSSRGWLFTRMEAS